MRLLPLFLTLLLVTGAVGCERHDDDDDDHATGYSVIYDGPPTAVEVERQLGSARQTAGFGDIVRIETHGDILKFVDTSGRIRGFAAVLSFNVRPANQGKPPEAR